MSVSELLISPKSWSDLQVKSINVSGNFNNPNQPGVSYRSAVGITQVLTTDVDTLLTMNGASQWNNGGYTFNAGTITLTNDGIYYVSYSVLFNSNTAAGYRSVWILSSLGSLRYGWSQIGGMTSDITVVSGGSIIKLSAGDTIQFRAQQNSGASVTIGNGTGGENNSLFHILKLV
jgi:hypothetical protein